MLPRHNRHRCPAGLQCKERQNKTAAIKAQTRAPHQHGGPLQSQNTHRGSLKHREPRALRPREHTPEERAHRLVTHLDTRAHLEVDADLREPTRTRQPYEGAVEAVGREDRGAALRRPGARACGGAGEVARVELLQQDERVAGDAQDEGEGAKRGVRGVRESEGLEVRGGGVQRRAYPVCELLDEQVEGEAPERGARGEIGVWVAVLVSCRRVGVRGVHVRIMCPWNVIVAVYTSSVAHTAVNAEIMPGCLRISQ